jgi:hypothetical protein
MKNMQRLAIFAVGLLLAAGIAGANTFTTVTIPVDNNVQTGLISTFPTSSFTGPGGVPYNVAGNGSNTCGPRGTAACNFYDGFDEEGSSITLDVSVADPTEAFTLMNAYSPQAAELATIEFVGTGGTSITFELVGGSDIRDFYQGSFTNTLTNGVSGVTATNAFTCSDPSTCLGAGTTGNMATGDTGTCVIDQQTYNLGTTFAGQTLTEIIITDEDSNSTPILLGATVESGATTAPEPGSMALLLVGIAALLALGARRALAQRGGKALA